MIHDLGMVLSSLRHFMVEGVCKGGWISTFTLCDDVDALVEYPAHTGDDVVAALERLKAMELAEQDPAAPDYWRISMKFYNDLPEWGARVIETLVDYPGWHSQKELAQLVAEVRLVTIEPEMLETIMAHLAGKSENGVEFQDDCVRIRFSEWLKRCQTPAHSS